MADVLISDVKLSEKSYPRLAELVNLYNCNKRTLGLNGQYSPKQLYDAYPGLNTEAVWTPVRKIAEADNTDIGQHISRFIYAFNYIRGQEDFTPGCAQLLKLYRRCSPQDLRRYCIDTIVLFCSTANKFRPYLLAELSAEAPSTSVEDNFTAFDQDSIDAYLDDNDDSKLYMQEIPGERKPKKPTSATVDTLIDKYQAELDILDYTQKKLRTQVPPPKNLAQKLKAKERQIIDVMDYLDQLAYIKLSIEKNYERLWDELFEVAISGAGTSQMQTANILARFAKYVIAFANC